MRNISWCAIGIAIGIPLGFFLGVTFLLHYGQEISDGLNEAIGPIAVDTTPQEKEYITVKAWGVQLPFGTWDIDDIVYDKDALKAGKPNIEFTDINLGNQWPDCVGPFYTISKREGTPTDEKNMYYPFGEDGTKKGDKKITILEEGNLAAFKQFTGFYIFIKTQPSCTDGQDLETEYRFTRLVDQAVRDATLVQ